MKTRQITPFFHLLFRSNCNIHSGIQKQSKFISVFILSPLIYSGLLSSSILADLDSPSYTLRLLKIHIMFYLMKDRSSRSDVFCKKGVLRYFTKFTGKHLCQSFFFNKFEDLRPEALLKKRLWHRCFPVKFMKFPRTPFITEHLWWLFLGGVVKKYQLMDYFIFKKVLELDR